MNTRFIARTLGIILLIISGYTYLFGGVILRLFSYQGPLLGTALLTWSFINIGEILYTKKAIIPAIMAPLIAVPWLIPQIVENMNNFLIIIAFLSLMTSGFLEGLAFNFLAFHVKAILLILGVVIDLSYLGIIYYYSSIFHIPSTIMLNYLLIFVYCVKFPSTAVVTVYIMKRLNF
ncbi:hypothetical protein HS7_00580 [Sulfolobales archaeon HS-7]|nr:hypothetical protein HS7_00580 [Sulfolobales archaeon HS-7]